MLSVPGHLQDMAIRMLELNVYEYTRVFRRSARETLRNKHDFKVENLRRQRNQVRRLKRQTTSDRRRSTSMEYLREVSEKKGRRYEC